VREFPEGHAEFEYIIADLWFRKDGKPMSSVKMLFLGTELNNTLSVIKRSTFTDNLHSTMSYISNVVEGKEVVASGSDEDPVSVPALTGAMVKMQSVAKGSKKQCSKYAAIAIGFHRNGLKTSNLEVLSQEYGVDIGVTHLSNPRLLKLDRSGMVLGIHALSTFLSPANTPKAEEEDGPLQISKTAS